MKKVDPFDRNINIELIQQIRNSEKISLDNYIDNVLMPFKKENPYFLKTLYKDIFYLLDGLDSETDNDLVIENGDFLIEDGDLKLSGYQTRLHEIIIWLHIEVISELSKNTRLPDELSIQLENFEKNFLIKNNYTPEYKTKLDNIKKSLKKERKINYDLNKSILCKYIDFDILELKPNFFGLGINLNEIINKTKNK